VTGFRLRLVVFFVLLSLVPLSAAFYGFRAVVERSETRRVDARLQAELRGAVTVYEDDLGDAEAAAARLAERPALARALGRGERGRVPALLRSTPNASLELAGGEMIGGRPSFAARATAPVESGPRRARVVVSVPLDADLVGSITGRAAFDPSDMLVILRSGRIVAGPPPLVGVRLRVPAERWETTQVAGRSYRTLVAHLRAPGEASFALLAPKSEITSAAAAASNRLLAGLAVALALVAAIAAALSRSVVTTLRRVSSAANAIARGDLTRRVPVRGRDELAQLGRAFNEMAAELQARMAELEAERRRLRETTLRFGEALSATHDVANLRRVVVETAIEVTRARSGRLVGDDVEPIELGDLAAGGERIELPLLAGSSSFGTLVLVADAFSDEEREAAALLAGQAVIALENARLHEIVERQAQLDELTALPNRRRAEELLAIELARAERHGSELALVFADLDGFKGINDRYGHATGDEVLSAFAGVLRANVREIDHAGRWGGDEFVVILPSTDLESALHIAERLRLATQETPLETPAGERLWPTASFGIACFPQENDAASLLGAADDALYRAKRGGRNRVVTARDARVGA